MGTTTQIPVEEYLAASYSPDKEFVEGVLVERNVGDWLHSLIQSNLIFLLRSRYPQIKAVPELRVRVAAERFRLPDVSVVLAPPPGRILDDSPYIAIEILSKDDAMSDVLEKLTEYAAIGTLKIWLFDPRARLMYTYQPGRLEQVTAEAIATTGEPRIELGRAEIFHD